ncbi:694_t:CDS:1 [Acaulospora morrowiae]|uniref:694_t:CDS:1 n=1 Tax=Acaulospora morrowiae TaxID=94023 RepID=A0A9N8VUJ8_9GLOM|nr:694_t:CDS:1 [Acaulospora morrowiae]
MKYFFLVNLIIINAVLIFGILLHNTYETLLEFIQIWLSKPEDIEEVRTDESHESEDVFQSTNEPIEEEVFVMAPKYDSEVQNRYEEYMQYRFDARLQAVINKSYHTPEGLNDDGTPKLVREDAFYISRLDAMAAEAFDEWTFENTLVESPNHNNVSRAA